MTLLDEPRDIIMYDGGIPRYPTPPWNYILTFNIEGLTNEYFGTTLFLRDWKQYEMPCFEEYELVDFPVGQLEAFTTAGGTSTMPWTFVGKLRTLQNKTIRWPGHYAQWKAFNDAGLIGLEPIEVDGTPVVPRHLLHTIEQAQLADRLLFATDYPHWDFDSPTQALPRAMPKQMREAIQCDNALALYGLPRERAGRHFPESPLQLVAGPEGPPQQIAQLPFRRARHGVERAGRAVGVARRKGIPDLLDPEEGHRPAEPGRRFQDLLHATFFDRHLGALPKPTPLSPRSRQHEICLPGRAGAARTGWR